MHDGNPRMLQSGCDSSLASEPFCQLGVRKMRSQHLYSYWSAEVFIDPAPHFTHASVPQRRL
jgi:hypothetical protein